MAKSVIDIRAVYDLLEAAADVTPTVGNIVSQLRATIKTLITENLQLQARVTELETEAKELMAIYVLHGRRDEPGEAIRISMRSDGVVTAQPPDDPLKEALLHRLIVIGDSDVRTSWQRRWMTTSSRP